jgi:hypothetical protein
VDDSAGLFLYGNWCVFSPAGLYLPKGISCDKISVMPRDQRAAKRYSVL